MPREAKPRQARTGVALLLVGAAGQPGGPSAEARVVGIERRWVADIRRAAEVLPAPGAPPPLAGLALVGPRLFQVVDLAMALGLRPPGPPSSRGARSSRGVVFQPAAPGWLVLTTHRDRLALLVDGRVGPSKVPPVADDLPTLPFTAGWVLVAGQRVTLLSPERLIETLDAGALVESARSAGLLALLLNGGQP